MPEPAMTEQDLWHDLQPLLDQELSRLPDKYRVAIVLCDLEGKTRKEAARQLGVPDGTLAARLARGRVMLAKRLARHGLVVSGGSLAAVLSQSTASACVPTSVVTSTIKAASLFASGQAAASGVISVKVAALTEGVLKTMLLTKLKIATAVVLAVAALSGTLGLIYHAQAVEQTEARKEAQLKGQAKPEDNPKSDGAPKARLQEAEAQVAAKEAQLKVAEVESNDAQVRMEHCKATFALRRAVLAKATADGAAEAQLQEAMAQVAVAEADSKLAEVQAKKAQARLEEAQAAFALAKAVADQARGVRQPAEKQEQPQVHPTWKIGPTLQGHGGQVYGVAFSPDGKRLASASSDKTVIVWDVAKRDSIRTLSHDGIVVDIAFAPDGKRLATASGTDNDDYLIKFWDPETGKEQAVLKGHTHPVHSVTFSRDGKILVSTSSPINVGSAGADRGEVCFWDVGTKEKIATLKAELVYAAALSHDRKKLVTASSSREGTVKLWEIDGKFAATRETVLVQDELCCLVFSPDGKTLVTAAGSDPSTANLWDVETGKILKSFEHKKVSVRSVAFAPDGKTLATGCFTTTKKGDGAELAELGGEVKFWDLTTGEEKQTLREKLAPVMAMAFAPDGKTLAVGLMHKENVTVKLGKKEGGFEPPADSHNGVVVLCELKNGKR